MTIKPYLTLAAGFALGVTSTALACRQEPAARPPLVAELRGHVTNGHPPRDLRPLTLRVGDDLTQLGHPLADRPAVATVYLDVSGVLVIASFELAVGE